MKHPSFRAMVSGILAVTAGASVAFDVPPVDTPTATPTTQPTVRGMYGEAGGPDTYAPMRDLGVNTVYTRPHRAKLNQLHARGMQAVVWLGEYDRGSCTFEFSDRQVRAMVRSVAGNPAIAAYQVADEPRATSCPSAPDDIAARADLVASVDDGAPTYVTIDTWNGERPFPYDDFAGTTDVMGLVVYPCGSEDCDLGVIHDAIVAAEDAGVERYWGVLQGFQDDYYTMPSVGIFTAQMHRWLESDVEGITIFSWSFGNDDVSRNETLRELIKAVWSP